MLRILIALFLSLMLAATSATLAVARGQAAGLTDMVICSDGAALTVTVDAQGNPVDRPHHCPDCLVQAGDTPATPSAPRFLPVQSPLGFYIAAAPDLAGRDAPQAAARGPPLPV